MRSKLTICAVAALAAVLAACGGDGEGGGGATLQPGIGPPAATSGLISTSCGSFQPVAQGASYAYLGIAYAAAPIGAARWQAPRAAPCLSNVQQAAAFGAKCPQLDRETNGFAGSEDCLTLNLWVPAAIAGNLNARRPVIFFIHGGGNSLGSSAEMLAPGAATYRGDRLAIAADAIIVTANYRIGPLGYLTHPGLDAESVQGSSGNYGILDLTAALRWVRDHVASFGGDPTRVMVFGQSAGGTNTCALVASPLASNLFHAAAILSGGCPSRSRAAADAATQSLATKSGCAAAANPLACLRGKTPEELLRADPPAVDVAGVQAPWQPHVDGHVLRASPLATFAAGGQNRVPIAIMATSDETSRDVSTALTEGQYVASVNALFGALAPQVLAQYPLARFDSSPWRAYTQLTTDLKFVCPSRQFARALARTQQEPVFRALFAEAIDAPNVRDFGAFHGAEILFVFDNLDVSGYQAPADERSLRDAIQNYFRNLATTREPNGPSLPNWQRYDGALDNHLVLEGDGVRMDAGLRTARCDFWDQVFPDA